MLQSRCQLKLLRFGNQTEIVYIYDKVTLNLRHSVLLSAAISLIKDFTAKAPFIVICFHKPSTIMEKRHLELFTMTFKTALSHYIANKAQYLFKTLFNGSLRRYFDLYGVVQTELRNTMFKRLHSQMLNHVHL